MYCPSCGSEVTPGLNYCNRCGAALNTSPIAPERPPAPVSLTGPTIAIAAMVVTGLAILLGSVRGLARDDVHPVALTWIVIGGLGMILAVAALLMRQWSQLSGMKREKERPAPRVKPENDRLPAMQLPPMRSEPVSSVTDHTTRTFEPAKRKAPGA